MGLSDHYQFSDKAPALPMKLLMGLCCQHFEIHMASDSGHTHMECVFVKLCVWDCEINPASQFDCGSSGFPSL